MSYCCKQKCKILCNTKDLCLPTVLYSCILSIKNKSFVTEQHRQFTHALTHIRELLHCSFTPYLFLIFGIQVYLYYNYSWYRELRKLSFINFGRFHLCFKFMYFLYFVYKTLIPKDLQTFCNPGLKK